MLFAYVRGVLAVAPETEIRTATRLFYDAFGGNDDYDLHSATREYYRMLHEFLNDKNILL